MECYKTQEKRLYIFFCTILGIIFSDLAGAFFYTAGLFKKPFYIFEIILDYLGTIIATLFLHSIFKKGILNSWVATIFLCMLLNFSEYIILIFLPEFQFHVRGKENAYINIMVSCQDGFTTFRVKNTLYSEVDFHKIWLEGYSTKGNGRGTGLANYKKILECYENVFPYTSIQDGYFIQELKIQE